MITDEKILELGELFCSSYYGKEPNPDWKKVFVEKVREWLAENVREDWKLELLTWIGKNATHPDETNVKRIAVSSLLSKIHKM